MSDLHIRTPLIESLPLSRIIGSRVWLKIESLQPSGSFKLRGIGRVCSHCVANGARELISSSGGNAGIAVAYSGRKLGVPVTVVVPGSTSSRAIELIRQQNGAVIVHGETWQEAHARAVGMTTAERVCIHPFDDPLLWQGHATLIDEVTDAGVSPDAVVLSVGGGGLLCGVIEGLRSNSLGEVPVLGVETAGAASLAGALAAGKLIELERITSIATSLGAKKVAPQAFEYRLRHEIASLVVSDRQAVDACLRFADDHRVLVEPACGAALAAIYEDAEWLKDKTSILVVVCGGAGVTMEQLRRWEKQLA
ncbi:MAG: pyridoxal-phosphate dependent enzyme [Desulfofustis sp.]|nr:pyridoxal-phosphate dependent enzyme [Desulfofustis sp.]